jgi:hypothetical protein
MHFFYTLHSISLGCFTIKVRELKVRLCNLQNVNYSKRSKEPRKGIFKSAYITMVTKVDLGTHHNNFRGEISHSK